MENPSPPTTPRDPRLDEAMQALARFAADADDDVAGFLERHAHLRDLLEPMLFVPRPVEAEEGNRPPVMLGKFKLLRPLGHGGMGTVYAAEDTLLRRTVALKLLAPHLLLAPKGRQRFAREAAAMARLDHPNIVKVFEGGEADGQPFLAMELVDGVSLATLLQSLRGDPGSLRAAHLTDALRSLHARQPTAGLGPASRSAPTWPDDYLRIVVNWVIQVAEALACAHAALIVHRDVKPGNILITRDGSAMLSDFGLARDASDAGVSLTRDFAGTMQYASPEQFDRSLTLDGRSDVFSLGVTLYELLTQTRPFGGTSVVDVQRSIEQTEPPPPRSLNPNVPRDLAAVVEGALEKDRDRRYLGAEAFAADLRRWRDGFTVSRRPATRVTRVQRWVGRNRLASAFLAMLFASTIAVSLLAWQAWSAEQAATQNEELARGLLAESLGDLLGAQLRGIRHQAETLYPDTPAVIEPLGKLIASFEELSHGLPQLHQQLSELRRGAQLSDADDVDARADRSTHPLQRQIAWLEVAIVDLDKRMREDAEKPDDSKGLDDEAVAALTAERARLEHRLAILQRRVAGYRSHRFGDARDRVRHDRLEDTLLDFATFASDDDDNDELDDLRRRLARVQAVHDSLRAHDSAWQAAIAAVRADSRFGGLELTPQPGLVPIGADSRSGLQEFTLLASGEPPVRRESGSVCIAPDTGIVLVLLPPGEGPVRGDARVRLAPFFCSKFEVSVAQMRRLTAGLRPDAFGRPRWPVAPDAKPCSPARLISWDLAAELLPRFGLSLPTGAQWEYACRAGATTWWYTGDDVESLRGIANLLFEEHQTPQLWDVDHPTTPNAFGLCHVHGNLGEWLEDYVGVPGDPTRGQLVPSGPYRWLAGGLYCLPPVPNSSCNDFDAVNSGLAAETTGIRPIRALDRNDGEQPSGHASRSR